MGAAGRNRVRGSLERVRAVIHGQLPDRAPLYDLLRNDAVLSHFAGEPLTIENGPTVVFRAYEPALDATRPAVRVPNAERTETLEDGRLHRHYRWTSWLDPVVYADTAAYVAAKRAELNAYDPSWTLANREDMERFFANTAELRRKLGEVFLFPGAPSLGLMGIYGEVGFEAFCGYLCEAPDIIDELLEWHAYRAVQWIEHLPSDHGIEAVFVGDDIAYKGGPLLSPAWFQEHYFHRMHRVCRAYRAKGIRVLFHSDGDLNLLLDGLVEAGIDGLNPIEVTANMDVGDIHRRFPHLFLAGGIDVSQLLPYGTPGQVRDAVRKALDAAEGRLMVGSSTELNNEVPLENYLALREAALDYRYG